jgi:hypothetical protein
LPPRAEYAFVTAGSVSPRPPLTMVHSGVLQAAKPGGWHW